MNTNILLTLARLSNDQLISRVKDLARCEQQATARLVAHLAELDTRRLYLSEGCSSLFTYCTEVLHLSEHAAYNRIEAARAARRFPVLLQRLAEGSVHLTAVRLLAPHFTSENHRHLLEAARHKSKREVEELVARLRPLPPIPAVIRKLPEPRQGSITSGATPCPVSASLTTGTISSAASPPSPALPAQRAAELARGAAIDPTVERPASPPEVAYPEPVEVPLRPPRPVAITPLAPGRYKVQFTASAETCKKLRLAQDLLAHRIPDGDPAAIIDLALTVLVEKLAKQKIAATPSPRASRRPAPRSNHGSQGSRNSSRHIPAEVKRQVWKRDGGRCAFMSRDGRRCTERRFLEFHHVEPYALGGPATVENIRLSCKNHNTLEAEKCFGPYSVKSAKSSDSFRGEFTSAGSQQDSEHRVRDRSP
jgi:hypothetical protein